MQSGYGGEVQLAFPHAAIAGGYTPYGFLVSTFTARGMFRPGNGPVTITVARDSVKDSQLSYAGLRDPAGNTLGNQGQIWGGVVANQGNVQFSRGDASSGFYFGAGGQYLTGYHVESNTRIDGNRRRLLAADDLAGVRQPEHRRQLFRHALRQ